LAGKALAVVSLVDLFLFLGSSRLWAALFFLEMSMSQAQLDREVANLTGESVSFIRSMGFSPMNVPSPPTPRQYARQTAVRVQKAQRIEPPDQVLRKAA
jgi:hypothetical protein